MKNTQVSLYASLSLLEMMWSATITLVTCKAPLRIAEAALLEKIK
jgi:hypothetical protein